MCHCVPHLEGKVSKIGWCRAAALCARVAGIRRVLCIWIPNSICLYWGTDSELANCILTDEGKAGVDQECTECAPALSARSVLRLQVAWRKTLRQIQHGHWDFLLHPTDLLLLHFISNLLRLNHEKRAAWCLKPNTQPSTFWCCWQGCVAFDKGLHFGSSCPFKWWSCFHQSPHFGCTRGDHNVMDSPKYCFTATLESRDVHPTQKVADDIVGDLTCEESSRCPYWTPTPLSFTYYQEHGQTNTHWKDADVPNIAEKWIKNSTFLTECTPLYYLGQYSLGDVLYNWRPCRLMLPICCYEWERGIKQLVEASQLSAERCLPR